MSFGDFGSLEARRLDGAGQGVEPALCPPAPGIRARTDPLKKLVLEFRGLETSGSEASWLDGWMAEDKISRTADS